MVNDKYKKGDFNSPPFGMFGYDEDKSKKVTQKQNETEQLSEQEKTDNLWKKLKKLVSTPTKPKPAQMQSPPVQEEHDVAEKNPDTAEVNERSTIKWRVPNNTKKVIVQICESNGRLINEYTISDFIRLSPGQILKVKAE